MRHDSVVFIYPNVFEHIVTTHIISDVYGGLNSCRIVKSYCLHYDKHFPVRHDIVSQDLVHYQSNSKSTDFSIGTILKNVLNTMTLVTCNLLFSVKCVFFTSLNAS